MSASEKKTLAPEYFEAVYAAKDDPWDFASSPYEAAKYAATIAALPDKRYSSAFEIGCSIGVLTARLALFCDALLAVDVNENALRQARARCAEMKSVGFAQMVVPDEFPSETFDLIVVSEVGYYLSAFDWRRTFDRITANLRDKGVVILVHWTHFVHDYPQTGDAVHDQFTVWAEGKLKLLAASRTADYRLDVWEKISSSAGGSGTLYS